MTEAALRAGKNLSRSEWSVMQRRAIFDFCKWDIHCDDHYVLAPYPLLMQRETAAYLNLTAEALSREALLAEEEILQRPDLLSILGFPTQLRKALRKAGTATAAAQDIRVMRFDFHPTLDGWRISEVNSDVPGGFIEASGWNSIFAESWPDATAPPSTSEIYGQTIREVAGPNTLVALVHATAYSDDRQVMQHLAKRFAGQGLRTQLLSPSHLRWSDGRPQIHADFASGRPEVVVRFFPAEWLPNLPDENCWKAYFQGARIPLSNPGSAILSQTKRFPLVWDRLQTDLCTWRRLLPETRDFADASEPLDDSWVLKPALGRVGSGVAIRGISTPQEFENILGEAQRNPSGWVNQRRFQIQPVLTENGMKYPCVGVFTINARAAGFYGRIADTSIISQSAQDVAVLIDEKCRRGEN